LPVHQAKSSVRSFIQEPRAKKREKVRRLWREASAMSSQRIGPATLRPWI
jgi:hypothetical protein